MMNPEYGPDSAGRLLYDQKIKHKHDAEQEHDQPDHGRLLEVLAERFEEGTGDVAIFIFLPSSKSRNTWRSGRLRS